MTEELAPSEVARRLGTSTRTVQRWIERGVLPARRVGGRWRVAFDAFDAFEPLKSGQDGAPSAIRTLFIANRGEIARRIERTCDRLGILAVAPETDGPGALDLLDADAVVATASASGADAVHPGFGFLAENAEFAERVIDAGIRWVGPPPGAIRAMGDKAAARRLAASLGIPVLVGYDDADQADGRPRRRGGTDRLSGAHQAGGRWRRQGDARRPRSGRIHRRPRGRPSRGTSGLRRRPRHPRALRGRRASRRGPGPLRCQRDRRPPRRTRLLDPAPSPEDPRGEPVAGCRGRPAPTTGRRGAHARARGRVRERRHLRIPRGRAGRADLHGDEHPAPGGAPGDRARHGSGPRGGPAPDRRRRTARPGSSRHPSVRPRDRGPPLRRGCGGWVPAGDRTGRGHCVGRSERASASMPGSTRAQTSGHGSTRCSPRSSPGAPTATRRSLG